MVRKRFTKPAIIADLSGVLTSASTQDQDCFYRSVIATGKWGMKADKKRRGQAKGRQVDPGEDRTCDCAARRRFLLLFEMARNVMRRLMPQHEGKFVPVADLGNQGQREHDHRPTVTIQEHESV